MRHECVDQFLGAIRAKGLKPPTTVVADGTIHRFSSSGRPDDTAGWYVAHDGDFPAGAFGCWRGGFTESWKADIGRPLTGQEEAIQRALAAEARKLESESKVERQLFAATTAADRWNRAEDEDGSHPYLVRKGVFAHGLRRFKSSLLVPLVADGKLWSLQSIGDDGNKLFMPGGRKTGCSYIIGEDRLEICIAEGFATAATIHEATGKTSVVAFDAGNLTSVAKAFRADYPQAKLVLCADDDHCTTGNPGVSKAREAAAAVGGYVAVPDFGEAARGEKDTDFNDLARVCGTDAVREQIERACLEEPAALAGSGDDTWPEVQEIGVRLAPEEPFPVDALPGVLGDAVREYQAYGQQPMSLVASSALAVVSLAAQGHYDVARDSALSGPISLNLMVVAQSGERKTAADKVFSKPIREWERRRATELKDEISRSKAERASWDAVHRGIIAEIEKAAKGGGPSDRMDELREKMVAHTRQEPKVLEAPRLTYEDANPQSLPFSLQRGHPSASLWSDEGAVVTGSHGMGKESFAGFMGLLNRLWDGGKVDQDRKVSASVHIERRRLTVSLMVQPVVLEDLVARSSGMARGSGNLARYLITAPDSTMGGRFYIDPPVSMPAVAGFHNRITALLDLPLSLDETGGLETQVLRLSSGAMSVWREYHDEVERELGPNGSYAELRDFGAKSAENAARIAACLHVLGGAQGPISSEIMCNAIKLARWYLNESLRLMGRLSEAQEVLDARALRDFLDSRWNSISEDDRSPRYISQCGPTSIRGKERRDAAFAVLESYGHYRCVRKAGRTVIERNPLLSGAATTSAGMPASANSVRKPHLRDAATATRATFATNHPWKEPHVADVAVVAVAGMPSSYSVSGEL